MADVVGMGEFLVDFATLNINPNGFPTLMGNPGGAVPNCLAAMVARGINTAFIAKVGKDAFGERLITTARETGMDTSGIIVSDEYFTTLAFVIIDESGDRSFSFSRKKSADIMLDYDEIDTSIIDEAKVLHVGAVSLTDEPVRTAEHRLVEYAKDSGKLITCDPNLRESLWKDLEEARSEIIWLLCQADIVKISDNEVDFLWGISPEEGAQKILEDCGAKAVFVTCGAEGALYANRKCQGWVKGPEVKPVDTTGAGDIFGGTAIAEILKSGIEPEDMIDEELGRIALIACTAASLSTESYGGISSVPPMDTVDRLL